MRGNAKLITLFCLGLWVCCGLPCLSQAAEIALAKNITCESYAGQWQGVAVDASGLFGNGGPWDVRATFFCDKPHQQVRGLILSTQSFLAGKFWGHARRAMLTKVTMGDKKCGRVGDAMMLARKALVIRRYYENAMTGTTLLYILHQTSAHIGKIGTVPWRELKTLESCH